MTVVVGKPAPVDQVEVWTRDGSRPGKFSLAELRGQWVVLFFYPRDFSFLCPTEIAAFEALAGDFAQSGAKIVAVSTDSFLSHQAFFGQDEKLKNVDFPCGCRHKHSMSKRLWRAR